MLTSKYKHHVTPNNKFYFISLGCPRNLVDSEVMIGILLRCGYELTQDLKKADYLVLNTCAFLKQAREESKSTLQEIIKEKKKESKIILTGCIVSKHKEELKDLLPHIHYTLGSGDIENILQAISSSEKGENISSKSYLESGEVPRTITGSSCHAYLKIAEGCRKKCSFCIIPKIKGPLKSKSLKQISKEFSILSSQGIKEISLIAQDLGDYGKDFGSNTSSQLVPLLKNLLKKDFETRIRLMYLYPDEITKELILLMKKENRILPYIDIPIQHISSRILKQMNRKTTGKDIKEIISQIRENVPEIHIRTSLMVGFPGETEEDFQELASFIEEYCLEHIGVFQYSREEGTPSFNLPHHLPPQIKEERQKVLYNIQKNIVISKNKSFLGKILDVLIEGPHEASKFLLKGRYYGQAPEIDGCVIINDSKKVKNLGAYYKTKITGFSDYDLIGKVL